MTPTLETRWAQLRAELCAWREYPKTAVAALRAERENFLPLMLAEFAAQVEDPDRLKEDAHFILHFHLLVLLAEWRETAVWPSLLQLFRRMDRELYEAVYGIEGNEYLTPLITTLMPEGMAPLDEVMTLLEMPKVSVWLRGDVLDALWARVDRGLLPREELSSRLRQALARERAFQLAMNVEARDESLLTMMLGALTKLGDAQSIPLVQPLLDEQLIDPDYWGRTVEDYAVYMRGEKVWTEEYTQNWVDDATAFMKTFFYYKEEKKTGKTPYFEKYAPPVETIRSGPKIGRNAPCPCGSGKKYKKCCGA